MHRFFCRFDYRWICIRYRKSIQFQRSAGRKFSSSIKIKSTGLKLVPGTIYRRSRHFSTSKILHAISNTTNSAGYSDALRFVLSAEDFRRWVLCGLPRRVFCGRTLIVVLSCSIALARSVWLDLYRVVGWVVCSRTVYGLTLYGSSSVVRPIAVILFHVVI